MTAPVYTDEMLLHFFLSMHTLTPPNYTPFVVLAGIGTGCIFTPDF
jgi:hypothetical protein